MSTGDLYNENKQRIVHKGQLCKGDVVYKGRHMSCKRRIRLLKGDIGEVISPKGIVYDIKFVKDYGWTWTKRR